MPEPKKMPKASFPFNSSKSREAVGGQEEDMPDWYSKSLRNTFWAVGWNMARPFGHLRDQR